MSFLALLLALAMERFSSAGRLLQHDDWFDRWQAQLSALGLSGRWQLLVAVFTPCLIAQAILWQLQPLLFGLAWIAAAVVLLLYAFGRSGHNLEQERYRSHCRRGDFEAALLAASHHPEWFPQDGELSPQCINECIQQGFLYQGYQRWFSVLFYFLLAGPVGALAYRLLQLASARNNAAERPLFYADWLPVRLLAATFALAGNFVTSLDEVWSAWRSPVMPASAVLHSVAVSSTQSFVQVDEPGNVDGQSAALQNEAFSALMRRASVCWVAILSVLVILL